MATWHQDRARKPASFADKTLWTVVIDPPGQSRSIMRWETEQAARSYSAKFLYSHVIPPSNQDKS